MQLNRCAVSVLISVPTDARDSKQAKTRRSVFWRFPSSFSWFGVHVSTGGAAETVCDDAVRATVGTAQNGAETAAALSNAALSNSNVSASEPAPEPIPL